MPGKVVVELRPVRVRKVLVHGTKEAHLEPVHKNLQEQDQAAVSLDRVAVACCERSDKLAGSAQIGTARRTERILGRVDRVKQLADRAEKLDRLDV